MNEYKSDQHPNKHLPTAEVLKPLKRLPETKNIKLILKNKNKLNKIRKNAMSLMPKSFSLCESKSSR